MSKTKLKGLSSDAKPLVMLAEVNQALTVGRNAARRPCNGPWRSSITTTA